jgi:hypothetical protein
MASDNPSQRQRSQNNPLNMGQFSQLSLRNLKGKLGPTYQVIGRRDTNQNSNGGYGGGTYNHWFSFTITSPAWIIVTKAGTRSKFIDFSVYDLNITPIDGRSIFQADSIEITVDGKKRNPYLGNVMGEESDLYNTYDPNRLDKGDERYFPLERGTYLLCVFATRNEPIDYQVGVVIEFPTADFNIALENYDLLLLENGDFILNDKSDIYDGQDTHQHSLSEWTTAWERDHAQDDRFPAIFVPLTTVP